MSEQEFKLTQKVFALIERMVKETPVRNLQLAIGKHPFVTADLDFSFTVNTQEIHWQLAASVVQLTFAITTTTHEIVEQFTHPLLCDAEMEALQAHVLDLDVNCIIAPQIHHYDEQLDLAPTCKVFDFFKKFKVNEKLFYTTTIHSIHTYAITTPIKNVSFALTTTVKENLQLFRRLTIERLPVELSYIPEKEQLVLWRNAVIKTKQEPRYLKMMGVYTGVPYHCIETEKISLNPVRNSLSYHFKAKFPANLDEIQLRDIALFSFTPPAGEGSTSTPSLVMVKK